MLKRLLTIAALTLLSSIAYATTYPLTVKDQLGRTVTISNEPKNIVVMLPSHTEMIYALGAGGRVIGRDESRNSPNSVGCTTRTSRRSSH
jgi:iron complex transport system substrate-binding protein